MFSASGPPPPPAGIQPPLVVPLIASRTLTVGTPVTFQAFREQTNIPITTDAYQCIVIQEHYRSLNKSLEELRLEDYAQKRGLVKRASPASKSASENFKLTFFGQLKHTDVPLCKLDIEHSILVKVTGDENESKSFKIPQHFLQADYFKKCLSRGWSENKKKIIKLKDIDPTIFERYLEWLYTGQLKGLASYGDKEQFFASARLYILGDRLQHTVFKNVAIEHLRSLVYWGNQSYGDAELVCLVFDNLPEGSPLRRFIVDMELFRPTPSLVHRLKTSKQQIPIDYLCDMLAKSRNPLGLATGTWNPANSPILYREVEGWSAP